MKQTSNEILSGILDRLPAPLGAIARWLVSAALGLFLSVILHYALYRVGLPSKPFIYVAF